MDRRYAARFFYRVEALAKARVFKIKTYGGNPYMWVFIKCGDDVRNFEPKVRLKFEDLDKSIQKLRAIYKVHPEWFEVPKSKSDKGRNVVEYSIEN